jgi:hypothetical protein
MTLYFYLKTLKYLVHILNNLNPPKQLSDLIDNASYNYGNYYELEAKYKAWQEWYNSQKKIFEEVK